MLLRRRSPIHVRTRPHLSFHAQMRCVLRRTFGSWGLEAMRPSMAECLSRPPALKPRRVRQNAGSCRKASKAPFTSPMIGRMIFPFRMASFAPSKHGLARYSTIYGGLSPDRRTA